LTTRQENILHLIIQEYVTSPSPISSKALVENYDLGISSATVRNDMAALEEMGLLTQPHTSAGRVPTDAGYRYFVQSLLNDTELSSIEQQTIRHQFHQTHLDLAQWMRLAAAILARTVQSVSLITSPQTTQNRYKHMALIVTEGRLVLMVLVLQSGDLLQHVLTLSEPVSQEALSQTADRLNRLCEGLAAEEVLEKASHLDLLEQHISKRASDVLHHADAAGAKIIHDGVVNILNEPEFESEGVRQTLRMLEEREMLEDVLEVVLSPETDGVQVMIAGEGRWEELSHCSIILSRYGVLGQASGALGVVGPTRMRYGRAISAVRYVSEVMNDMLLNIHQGSGEGQS
jgi:heat-inducible transcriptional repressor